MVVTIGNERPILERSCIYDSVLVQVLEMPLYFFLLL